MGNVQDAPAYIQNLKIIPGLLYIWGLMTQTQWGIMCLLNVTLPQQLAILIQDALQQPEP